MQSRTLLGAPCLSRSSVSSLGRDHTPYGMAMAAVIQMTRELSTEWNKRGVRTR